MNKSKEKVLMERAILKSVYHMATESLSPDSFEELEQIIQELCKTRGLGVFHFHSTKKFQDFPWKEFDVNNQETWPEDNGDYLLNINGALSVGHWRNREFFNKDHSEITHYIEGFELLYKIMGYREIKS